MNAYERAFGDILSEPDEFTFSSSDRETMDYFAEVESPPPLAASDVASTSSSTHAAEVDAPKCSQCGERNPAAGFPIRLATLEPYLICKLHAWYWTAAVKAKNWAPERVSQFSEIIEFVKAGNGAGGTWMVLGRAEERQLMLERITAQGDWTVRPVRHRKSRATSSTPPPPVISFHFAAPTDPEPGSSKTNFQLDFTHHPNVGRYIITIKPDKAAAAVVKRPAAWKNNKRLASPRATRTTKGSKAAQKNSDENAPPTKKTRVSTKQAKVTELEARNVPKRARTADEQRAIELDLERLRQAVSSHNDTTEPALALNPHNLEQLLHVAAAVFLNDSTNPSSSRQFANLLAAEAPLPSPRRQQITPQKQSANAFENNDISPGSQFDELDSSEAGDNDRSRRGRSEDIDEEEELSEDDSDDLDDDGLWLTGLVRGELGNRIVDGEEEDDDYAW